MSRQFSSTLVRSDDSLPEAVAPVQQTIVYNRLSKSIIRRYLRTTGHEYVLLLTDGESQ